MLKLDSKNCVKLYKFKKDDDHFYFFMECCPNGDLKGYLEKAGGRFEEKDA